MDRDDPRQGPYGVLVHDAVLPYITAIPGWAVEVFSTWMHEADEFGDQEMRDFAMKFLRLSTSVGGKRGEQLTQTIIQGQAPMRDEYARIRPKLGQDAQHVQPGAGSVVIVNGPMNGQAQPEPKKSLGERIRGGLRLP